MLLLTKLTIIIGDKNCEKHDGFMMRASPKNKTTYKLKMLTYYNLHTKKVNKITYEVSINIKVGLLGRQTHFTF